MCGSPVLAGEKCQGGAPMTEWTHMTQSTVAGPAGSQAAGSPGHARRHAGGQWWRLSWSRAAALRAVRATIVVPGLFALTFKVIGDAQMTLFAVFGGFGALVMTSFGGSR